MTVSRLDFLAVFYEISTVVLLPYFQFRGTVIQVFKGLHKRSDRQLTMVTSIASQQKRNFLNLTDNKEI